MKLFGHPIHLMLVHFPSALLPMDFLCSASYFFYPESALTAAAFYAMMGGTLFGWLAVITGTFDLLSVMNENPTALKSALIHGGINTIVLSGYTIFAVQGIMHFPQMTPNGIGAVAAKAMLLAIMIVGNYLGANLILKHKIAVEK